MKYDMLTILGATASGKTSLAANLAYVLNGEILSADSRQVYKNMNLGTGKDLDDYYVKNKEIKTHLIDIVDAGYKYNIYEYQCDFLNAYRDIIKRRKFPVLCGGSGMYIEAVLKGYKLISVPADDSFRELCKSKNTDDLIEMLKEYKKTHNVSDTNDRKRLIRAIEIEKYYANHPEINLNYPKISSLLVGIKYDRDSRRKRITQRLKQRFDDGMLDEVKCLLDNGVSSDTLKYYGLEYKFITQHILGEITYNEMFSNLNTAIHQFAKRQMTWFRRMERNGIEINWLDGSLDQNEKIKIVLALLKK